MNINFAQLEIAGETNCGTVRTRNEDNFIIFAPENGSAVLAAVADGIGGHSHGEVASHICCKTLLQAARSVNSASWTKEFLFETLQSANERIFNYNFADRRIKPMGCTVAAAIFFRDRVITASAGDSRIYEYLKVSGRAPLKQLTVDHRPENFRKLRRDPRFSKISLISRSLGTNKFLKLDIAEFPRDKEAKYLICSDGLYGSLNDLVLAGILGDASSMRSKTSSLVRGAIVAGEHDNITVICAGTAEREG
jgi:protein phosphatase